MIVLTNPNSSTLNLGLGLIWEDQYNWNPVKGNIQYTIEGNPKVTTGSIQNFRPITLTGDNSRLSRLDLETLRDWSINYIADDQFFTLQIHSDYTFSQVKFRYWDDPVIEVSSPVGENYENRNNITSQYFNITIKLASFD